MDPNKPVKAEISADGKFIDIDFPYQPWRVEAVKDIASWRFVSRTRKDKRKVWRVALDMPTCRRLRDKFGDELEVGSKLGDWGHREVDRERNLIDLSMADDAELLHVPAPLLEGAKRPDGRTMALRPKQRADIAFMSQGKFVNANQPGFGKTAEYIGTIMEMELTWGQHLVLAPVTSLELVWEFELRQWYAAAGLDEPTIFTGDTPAARKRALREAKEYAEDGLAFWLVLNPAMARLEKQLNPSMRKFLDQYNEKTQKSLLKDATDDDFEIFLTHPELAEIDWDSMNIDEFHLMGLTNLGTQSAEGCNHIANETDPILRGGMSGTPMGGKPIKLFGPLQFVDPGHFPSKWHWARQWLNIRKSESDGRLTREIEGIKEGLEIEFYEYHKQWIIRRLKDSTLPPKQRISVWCRMTPKQKRQYATFEEEAELRIDDMEDEGRLTATNVLAEYTRLKQFASAYCEIKKSGIERKGKEVIEVIPTAESGKYDQLVEKLQEEGVITVEEDQDPTTALIFSQFNGVVEDGVAAALDRYKIPYALITGKVTGKNRLAVAQAFQLQEVEFLKEWPKKSKVVEGLIKNGPPRVLIMNTKAGGTTMTLTTADSVHILDETWDPDDQEQAEDRDHRDDDLTRLKEEIRIYYYRTRNTIEEMILEVIEDKEVNNESVLNVREKMRELYAQLKGESSGSDQDG